MDSNSYKIIQPPFTLEFDEMPKEELKAYFKWFVGIISDRVKELERAVQGTQGYSYWRADNTPESLDSLGRWLFEKVEMRPRNVEEIAEIERRSAFAIEVPRDELTNRTFSLAMDTGMYLSQVFLQNHPSLKWTQPFGNKNYIDYGRPVLASFSGDRFDPVHMMVTLAYGLADNTWDGTQLRKLYDHWSRKVVVRA